MSADPNFITTKVAAGLLGVTEITLKRKRFRGYKGPPGPAWYPRMGRIYYKRTELLEFLECNRQTEAPPDTRLPRIPPAPARV